MIEPIKMQVDENAFIDFINNYPRPLTRDVTGISDPPLISYNDFALADKWPDSVVASFHAYSDDPQNYYYNPEPVFTIMTNHQEVYKEKNHGTVQ